MQKGFTLIEVMVVMVVASILATIAWPNYLSSVRKARRADGKAKVVHAQIMQEKFRVDNSAYGNNTDLGISSGSSQDYYVLSILPGASAATDYSITATAQRDQANDSEKGSACNELKLTVTSGVESYAPSECWK